MERRNSELYLMYCYDSLFGGRLDFLMFMLHSIYTLMPFLFIGIT